MDRVRRNLRLGTVFLAGLALGVAPGDAAPSLRVLLKTGLVTETDVGNLRKLTFSTTTLTVIDKDGDSAQTPLTGIERMYFTLPSPVRPFPGSDPKGLLAWSDGAGAVRIRLPSGGRTSLALLGLQGDLVRDLGTPELTAGEHRLSLDAASLGGPGLPPGPYLFRIAFPGRRVQTVPFTWTP